MSFFEPLPPPPPEPVPEPDPEWFGPPPGLLGGVSTARVFLIRSNEVLLVAHRFLCFPTGAAFTVQLWLREPPAPADIGHFSGLFPPPARMDEEGFRFGVEYPDGSTWTDASLWERGRRRKGGDERPSPPWMFHRGGGGGASSFAHDMWMWPLPGEGTLRFVVAWPRYNIDECSVALDTADLRRAAAEAETAW